MGGYIPGKRDINNHFQAGAPIRRTRRIYDRISNDKDKDYKFGELTSLFMRYDEDQDDAWQNQIKSYYEQPYIDEIKGHVITVLSRVDPTIQNPQVSLKFEWVDPNGPAKVTMTQSGDAYTITISGLRAPPD
jgi:hypothetical protein